MHYYIHYVTHAHEGVCFKLVNIHSLLWSKYLKREIRSGSMRYVCLQVVSVHFTFSNLAFSLCVCGISRELSLVPPADNLRPCRSLSLFPSLFLSPSHTQTHKYSQTLMPTLAFPLLVADNMHSCRSPFPACLLHTYCLFLPFLFIHVLNDTHVLFMVHALFACIVCSILSSPYSYLYEYLSILA